MNHSLFRTYKRTRGLAISTILLAVVLLAAIAVTIAMSSRSSNGNSSAQQAKLNAATLMNQGANIRIGFDRMAANGTDPTTITLDTSGTAGLFNPTIGGTVQQFPPSAAFTGGTAGSWYYGTNVALEGIGTASSDSVVFVTDITKPVCQSIMNQLYGVAITNNPTQTAAANATAANIASGGVSGALGTAIDFTSDTNHATQNHPEGCFQELTPGTKYIYYKAAVEN